jgi:cellobiose phosphorylase
MYRLIVESLMGLRRESDRLFVHPCLPREWNECAMSYRFGETEYRIKIRQIKDSEGGAANGTGAYTIRLDGVDMGDQGVPLLDDHLEHTIDVQLGY